MQLELNYVEQRYATNNTDHNCKTSVEKANTKVLRNFSVLWYRVLIWYHLFYQCTSAWHHCCYHFSLQLIYMQFIWWKFSCRFRRPWWIRISFWNCDLACYVCRSCPVTRVLNCQKKMNWHTTSQHMDVPRLIMNGLCYQIKGYMVIYAIDVVMTGTGKHLTTSRYLPF